MDLTRLVAIAGSADPDAAATRWAESGAMSLTGTATGPPDVSPARLAVAMDTLADHLGDLTAQLGRPVTVRGADLLGERAALGELHRRGDVSCGGGSRLLRSADGWIAVSLARTSDLDLLPAWLGCDVPGDPGLPATETVWEIVSDRVSREPSADLVRRAAILGLPIGASGETSADGPVVEITHERQRRDDRRLTDLVVADLSSLWAGPLCAQLLGAAGARIIKIESTRRPDGARNGPKAFYDLLHAGHEAVALDFASPRGQRQLRRLLARADIVIEASRPRALAHMGITPREWLEHRENGIWVSITAHGRSDSTAIRTGFGDDAAVAGGLVAGPARAPTFCADAAADPSSGLVAAVATLSMMAAHRSGLVDVALARTAAHLARACRGSHGIQSDSPPPARRPRARAAIGTSASLGQHTGAVLSEIASPQAAAARSPDRR